MQALFFSLLFVVAFVVNKANVVATEETNSIARLRFQDGKTARFLRRTGANEEKPMDEKEDETDTTNTHKKRNGAIADERVSFPMINAFNGLSRRRPNIGKVDAEGAKDALSRVTPLFESNKAVAQITPQQAKELAKYAEENPEKWYKMSYYLANTFGVGLVVFLLYGTIFLGWRPLVGGPEPNAQPTS